MKANLTGFVVTALAWAGIGMGLTVALGVNEFGWDMLLSGLVFGSIVSAPATLLSLFFGGVRKTGVYAVLAGGMSFALYYGMSMLEFNDGHLLPSLVAAGFGLLAGCIGSATAKTIHGS